MRSKSLRAILLGGLIAGTLDITAAFVQAGLRGTGPVRILQFIASGFLGRESFEGGMATAGLGLLLHYVIALGAAAVYVGASHWLKVLIEKPVVCGLAYGVPVWAFMNLVVLPLAGITMKRSVPSVAVAMGILMVCIGLPIALTARRMLR
jgi:hypothetical protein